jgi:hypothetical protein
MKRALPIVCLAAAAGIWAWALLASKEPAEPLPERFRGQFQLAEFEPPDGRPMPIPLPPGRLHLFTFRADGSYVLSAMASGGFEMARREGLVAVDERGVLSLTQVSSNRREERAPPDRFRAEWGEDATGRFLSLRHLEQGYTYVLRPRTGDAVSSGR